MAMSSSMNNFLTIMKNPNKIKYLIKTADHVITSSPFLNNYCLAINDKNMCTYVSSSVNTNIFLPNNSYSNNHKVTIGWTGTFSSKPYLESLKNVFEELNNRCEFKLRIIGNFEYDIPGIDLEVIQWSKKNEVIDLQGIDVGIYPLLTNEWVLGKSGLKAIQYMAFGLPTVATDIGTTSKIITHLDNGWLVRTDEEWIEALEILIKDPSLRRRLGIKARQTVVATYSTKVVDAQYLAILNGL
jgi:glycosyltransferase involved in cell wall biosynthesis